MFFERPLFLLILLLALPWLVWLRRREPQDYAVGGLGPFRNFARTGGARPRGWPLSLLCALGALLCAGLALARPSFGGTPEYLVLDRSLSVRSCELPEPDPQGRIVLETEGDLLVLLSQLPARARAEVWTDRPPPRGLPARIKWNDESFQACAGPQSAILSARPLAPQRWTVHWIAEPGGETLELVSDAGDRADLGASTEGLTEIAVSEGATRLELRKRGGGAPDLRHDQDWGIAPDNRIIPAAWDPRWEEIAAAAWPTFKIRRGESGLSAPFEQDPLAGRADLDAVAFLAERLRAVADAAQPPRPASECRLAADLAPWPPQAAAADPAASALSVWLGGLGGALLLLSLLVLVIPLSARSDSRNATL